MPLKQLFNPAKIYLQEKLSSIGTQDILHLKHGLRALLVAFFLGEIFANLIYADFQVLEIAGARWIILG